MTETLQTIWTNLTTENVWLTNNIIIIPFYFIENWISMLLFIAILNITPTKRQKLLYVFILSIIGILNHLIITSPFNAFINIIIFYLGNILILKAGKFKGLLVILIPFIVTALLETILSQIFVNVFKIEYAIAAIIPIYRLSFTLVLYLIMYICYLIIKYYKLSFEKFNLLDKKRRTLLIVNVIFGIIMLCTQVYVTYFYSYILPLYIVLINLISLFVYILVSLYTVYTTSQLETASMNLEEAQLYNKTLEILQDNTRAFRHDFSNIVQGMSGYIDNNDMEGLKKYYSQLVEDIGHTNNLTSLSPKVVNNPAIYNVLANKYHKADSLGIKINLDVFLDLNDLHIKIYEFTRVLGILMDNAIEATSECEDKIINVTFRKDKRKHMELLVIENTYNNKDVDTDKIYEKGYSTKKGNTGLGLWEIRQILKKNNNLNLYTTKTQKFFSQQFEIYY